MKNTILLIAATLSLSLSVAEAQSNQLSAPGALSTNMPLPSLASTNIGQVLGLPSGVSSGLGNLFGGLEDMAPYVSNDIVNIDAGVLYNKSDLAGKFGGYVAASFPINTQSAVGVAGFGLNGQFGNATVNYTLGTTVSNVFLLGNVFSFVSSGPDYDWTKDPSTGQARGIGVYDAAGIEKNYDLGTVLVNPKWYDNWDIGWKVGVFNCSQVSGVGEFAGVQLVKHW